MFQCEEAPGRFSVEPKTFFDRHNSEIVLVSEILVRPMKQKELVTYFPEISLLEGQEDFILLSSLFRETLQQLILNKNN